MLRARNDKSQWAKPTPILPLARPIHHNSRENKWPDRVRSSRAETDLAISQPNNAGNRQGGHCTLPTCSSSKWPREKVSPLISSNGLLANYRILSPGGWCGAGLGQTGSYDKLSGLLSSGVEGIVAGKA